MAMLGIDMNDQPWVSVLLTYRRAALSPSGRSELVYVCVYVFMYGTHVHMYVCLCACFMYNMCAIYVCVCMFLSSSTYFLQIHILFSRPVSRAVRCSFLWIQSLLLSR